MNSSTAGRRCAAARHAQHSDSEAELAALHCQPVDDTTHRSLEIIDNRYLFLTKDKSQDYYDTSTGKLIQAIKLIDLI